MKKKFKYTEFERQMNVVLKHQHEELKGIHFADTESIDETIKKAEELLKDLGGANDAKFQLQKTDKEASLLIVPNWDELCQEAENHIGTQCNLEILFTEEELQQNELAIQQLNEEYNTLNKLDKYDVAIAAIAGIIGAATDILLVGIPQKSKAGLKAGPLSDYIRDYFDKMFPEEEMQKLANANISKVPYDAQDNRHTTIDVIGLSAYYHRMLQLGHDPLLGFIVGVADILSGRMTTIDKTGKFTSQVMNNYKDRTEPDLFSALAKQIIHLKSDVTTSMGLPVPLMSLFNFLQIGSIGEAEQTIAEIVQGMYYEGYDFIHFCSMSVSAMLVEVTIRVGYAFKRLAEGNAINKSIPFSHNRKQHSKLDTMLFIGHSAAAAANAGKLVFAKNPVAINYPEWLAFAKYSYTQLKWILLEKPARRDEYIQGKINEELCDILNETAKTFEDFSNNYKVVFH